MPESQQDQSTPSSTGPESPPAGPAPRGAVFAGKCLFLAWLPTLALLVVVVAFSIKMLNWQAPLAALGHLATLFSGSGSWEYPARTAAGFLSGALVLGAVFGLGYLWLGRWRPWRRMAPLALERTVLAPLAGAALLSLVVLAAGLAGWANRQAFSTSLNIILAGAVAIGSLGWIDFARDMKRGGWAALRRLSAALPRWIILLLVLAAALAIPYALSPSVQSDELRYHLAAPAMWLRDGRIHYVPYQAFFCFPMLGEMLFLLAMPLGGEEGAKLIHLGFLPVVAALVVLIARRMMKSGDRHEFSKTENSSQSPFLPRRRWAGLAGAAFMLIPTVPILAAWGFVDMFMEAYFLAFVYLAGRSLARPRRAAGGLIGLMGAGAIATKYTMIPLLGGLGAVWFGLLISAHKGRRARPVRLAIWVALVAMLFGGLWYLKNIAWTGNPVYPLAWSQFGGGEWSAENADFYKNKAHEKGMHFQKPAGAAGKVVELLASPITTAFFFNKFEDHPIGPVPLMAIIVMVGWILCRPGFPHPGSNQRSGWPMRKSVRFGGGMETSAYLWFAAALLGSWVFWFFTYQSNRLLLPTLGLALAAGAWAAWRWELALLRWAGRCLRLILAVGLLYAFILYFTILCMPASNSKAGASIDAVKVALGLERREVYLARKLNYWRAAQWLARHSRPGERAWLVGEHRTMHFESPVVASDWFDTPQPLALIRQTHNNGELFDKLLKDGIHYIFFNWAELRLDYLNPNRSYFKSRFQPEEFQRFEALGLLPIKGAPPNPRLEPIYNENQIVIYRIKSS